MVRFLCIVSRDRPELWEHLSRHFDDEPAIEVVLDRRRGERRNLRLATPQERRRQHRRWQPDNHEILSAVGAFLVPVDKNAFPVWPPS